ncbi:zinc finger SWIM domain-containing protein 7 isoform X2 [Alosa alosa]|uniref:zinc finger SWIM domain-containing protein 7 isoform X2 n=1 Tax=Alosa alosa TaxID=278164 RepID=UPI0020152DB4|nr:zinc finger SWIM domain-containing protein 7 isoform X2 [Alosa alosa]
MSSPIFPFVAEQLLKDIEKSYKERAQLPDDLLIALRYVFGSCALQALDLVDQRSVTCVSSPSGRRVFRVMGGSGQRYTCFTSCHYCPCPAFSILVLKRNTSLLSPSQQLRSKGGSHSTVVVFRCLSSLVSVCCVLMSDSVPGNKASLTQKRML